jgi:hypothetical protein
MKTRKIYSLLIVLMLFAAGAFMYACTPDKEAENIAPLAKSDNTEHDTEVECVNCYNDFIIKDAGNTAVTLGSFRVCEVLNEEDKKVLRFTYTASNGRTFNEINLRFHIELSDGTISPPVPSSSLNPSPKSFNWSSSEAVSSYTFDVLLSDIIVFINPDGIYDIISLSGLTIVMATNVQSTGSSGNNPGGQGWVGDLTLDGKYPFDRTFRFTFCGEGNGGGDNGCNKTQGFWKTHGPLLCGKGNNDDLWPISDPDQLQLGNRFYTVAQVCSIFNTPVGTGKKANGLISLAHQLIAAKFNATLYGTSSVDIAAADGMIGNLYIPGTIPPVGSSLGYLSPASVNNLVTSLTAFNESGVCGTN